MLNDNRYCGIKVMREVTGSMFAFFTQMWYWSYYAEHYETYKQHAGFPSVYWFTRIQYPWIL